MTIERVKAIRHAESERAAGLLGAEVRFFDAGDYPLRLSDAMMDALVQEYRACRPEFVLTHSYADPYNPDHPAANAISLQARVYAQAEGYPLQGPALGAPSVFMFEPHQPEQCGFKPDVLLDVTSVWEQKRAAMESMEAQSHLVQYYSDLSRRRGSQAVRNSGRKGIQHAEAFERVFPHVTVDLA
jgi:4-oxalomesaconate hydratase